MISSLIANFVTKPGGSPVFNNPLEIGVDYTDVTFTTEDGVKLSGWLLKGRTDKVVIITHFGLQSSRSGYTTSGKPRIARYHKNINYLDIAEHLLKEGYSVLMYDLRNHGNSEKGTNPWITGGVEEYKDVIAAVKFISEHKDYKDANIGLLSLCMGSMSTTYAFGPANGLQKYKNIKTLVVVQPTTLAIFLRKFRIPEFLIKSANRTNIKRGGKDLYSSCMKNVKNITVPTLVVQGEGDPWADLDWVKDYYNNVRTEKEIYWIKETKHRLDAYDWFGHTPDRMIQFFRKHL